MSRAIASAFAIHSLSLLLAANAVASTQPGDKPLSEILVPVEAHGTVISADQGRNRWEVVVCERIGNCTEVYLDRATGQELRRERENSLHLRLFGAAYAAPHFSFAVLHPAFPLILQKRRKDCPLRLLFRLKCALMRGLRSLQHRSSTLI